MICALLEVYSDDLIISSSQTTATGLSKVLDSQTSHDKITRFLLQEDWTPRTYGSLSNPRFANVSLMMVCWSLTTALRENLTARRRDDLLALRS
jgi:hypothetical protein